MSVALWAYPWDFLDEGPGHAAERIRATGADTVFVAALYHPVEHLQAHLSGRMVVHAADTRWFPWHGAAAGDPSALKRIILACRETGVKVWAWVVCCHAISTGRAHPDMAQRNAFGDVMHATLCPANPAVGQRLESALRALACMPDLEGVVLESLQYHPRRPETPYEKSSVELTPLARYLQGLCCCDCCTAQAQALDIDSRRVAAIARETWRRELNGDAFRDPVEDFVLRDPDLARYHEMRRVILLNRFRKCVAAALPLPTAAFLLFDRHSAGCALEDIAGDVDQVIELFHNRGSDVVATAVQRRLESVHASRYRASVSGFGPYASSAGVLEETMRRARAAGLWHLAVYHYGIMTTEQLGHLRHAIHAWEE